MNKVLNLLKDRQPDRRLRCARSINIVTRLLTNDNHVLTDWKKMSFNNWGIATDLTTATFYTASPRCPSGHSESVLGLQR